MADGSRLLNFGPFKIDDVLMLRPDRRWVADKNGTPNIKDGVVAVLEVLPKNRYWVVGERPWPNYDGSNEMLIKFETDGSLWQKASTN